MTIPTTILSNIENAMIPMTLSAAFQLLAMRDTMVKERLTAIDRTTKSLMLLWPQKHHQ
jgi:hypothetical protein